MKPNMIVLIPKGKTSQTILASRTAEDAEVWKRLIANPDANVQAGEVDGDQEDMGEQAVAQEGKPLSAAPIATVSAEEPETKSVDAGAAAGAGTVRFAESSPQKGVPSNSSSAPPEFNRSLSRVEPQGLILGDIKPYNDARADRGPAMFDKLADLTCIVDGKSWSDVRVCLASRRRTLFFFKSDREQGIYEGTHKPTYLLRFELHGGWVVPVSPLPDGRPVYELFTPTKSVYLTLRPGTLLSSNSVTATPLPLPTKYGATSQPSSEKKISYAPGSEPTESHALSGLISALHKAHVALRTCDRKEWSESKVSTTVMLGKHGELEHRLGRSTFKQVYVRTIENAVGTQVLAAYPSMIAQQPSLFIDLLPMTGITTSIVTAGLLPKDPDFRKQYKDSSGAVLPMADVCFTVQDKTGPKVFKAATTKLRDEWVDIITAILLDNFLTTVSDSRHKGPDYYEVLKLEPSASETAIRSAFKTMSQQIHPDKNKHPRAADDFIKLKEAYDVLLDQDMRARYDQAYRTIALASKGLRIPIKYGRTDATSQDFGLPEGMSSFTNSLLGEKANLRLIHAPEVRPVVPQGPTPAELEAARRTAALEAQNRQLEKELAQKRRAAEEARMKLEEEENRRKREAREAEEKRILAEQEEKKRRDAMDPIDKPLPYDVLNTLASLSSGAMVTKVSGSWHQSVREMLLVIKKSPLPDDDGALLYAFEWDSKKKADKDRIYICQGISVSTDVTNLPKELMPKKHLACTITPDKEKIFGWSPLTIVFNKESDMKRFLSVVSVLLDSTLRTALSRPAVKGPRKYLELPVSHI